jgi:hypothetical protein
MHSIESDMTRRAVGAGCPRPTPRTRPGPKLQHAELDREGDPEGEDVRIASVGQLSVIFFANRAPRHLSVLDIAWLW